MTRKGLDLFSEFLEDHKTCTHTLFIACKQICNFLNRLSKEFYKNVK